jgi:FAD synthetase
MTTEELVKKYVDGAQQAFMQIESNPHRSEADIVLDHAKRYLEDAKYYSSQKRFETALASIAYCEGLLDALKLLEMVKFQWQTRDE